ncbi:hypothetical protein BJP25_18035 [Actinokineospora bangkokensis]|uniref:AB hydrolase-1 domain-containing protein n=1 Tax=Actinokineospora bangkokensis TaxID=1193682 RepID=A0A1Q9LN06_9PSEU|nr:hypothetical protein BJP25_18035 [Actinokineospora bangkokensis]
MVLHGQRYTYLAAGTRGPVVVLLHGLAGDSDTWRPVIPVLAQHARVIAPDMLGCGRSAKPRSGDYSVAAYASSLRDLLVALGHRSATVVGHSLGGGVAMQFSYQFPEMTQRLVLVASGGLGHEVTPALRATTIPGSILALRLATTLTPKWVGSLLHRVARALPSVTASDLDELARSLAALADHDARAAFMHTARGALDITGQRLDATGKLYLTAKVPLLFIAGDADAVIPARHSVDAHEAVPHSRLELFEGAGHFPHLDDPHRFSEAVTRFLRATTPARSTTTDLRDSLLAGAS